MRKVSDVAEENERSALLAAIRSQSSSGRLRRVKSRPDGVCVSVRGEWRPEDNTVLLNVCLKQITASHTHTPSPSLLKVSHTHSLNTCTHSESS